MVVAALLLSGTWAGPGCRGGGPPPPAPCADPDCRLAGVLELAEGDLPAAIVAIDELPDELEQLLAMERLMTGDPVSGGLPPDVCSRFGAVLVRQRCEVLGMRMHLLTKSEPTGEEDRSVIHSRSVDEMAGCLELCEPTETPFTCAARLGRTAAEGRAPTPAGACDCLSDLDLHRECRFEVAQALVRSHGQGARSEALVICDFGGRFAQDCRWHVFEQVSGSERAPVP